MTNPVHPTTPRSVDTMEKPVGVTNGPIGWVSDIAAEMLQRLGIRYVALNPGASYRGLHDSIVNYLGNRDPQMLLCLHEDHAVSIAQGYARATGEPMGCILHSNVGLMHGMMGIFNAWCNRLPMLVLGANGPVDAPLRRPWIDWIHTTKDQGALVRNFVKWDDEPRSAEAMVESLCRANLLTRSAPTAPVYVCFDAGLQEQRCEADIVLPDLARYQAADAPRASDEAVRKAADILLNAKRAVIMPGRLSRDQADWDRRVKLAELLGAKVVTDTKTWAAFPTDHPLHVGPTGHFPRGAAKEVIAEADAILALDWVDLAGTFKVVVGDKSAVAAKVINCTLDSFLHNGWSMDGFSLPPADVSVVGDPDAFVKQLLAVVEGRAKAPALPPVAAAPAVAERKGEIGLDDVGRALAAAREGRQITLSNTALGWDAGFYPVRHPLDFLGHDGGGGLGSATGAAIGAALGLKDSGRLVVCVLGDGDFLQGASALWTAAHYGIPVMWLVTNNRSNFNDEIHQQTVAKERGRPPENKWIGQRIDDPAVDLAAMARSQGVEAEGPVAALEDLGPALERALDAVAAGRPYLLDVQVRPGYSAPLLVRADKSPS